MDPKELRKLFESLQLDEKVLNEVISNAQSVLEIQFKDQIEKEKVTIQEKMDEENETWRNEQIDLLEEKFEEYKEMIISKFSEFTDQVIQEEINIPERVLEYARKGQIYEPIIEEFKTKVAIDQGLIDEETKGIMKEARDKIIELTEKHDTLYSSNLDLIEENRKLDVKSHLLEKCSELTLEQKQFMIRVLGDASSVEEIDEKWDIVIEQAGKDWAGGKGSSLERKELNKGTAGDDDAAKKKGEGFKTAKGAKKEKGKDVSGAEGDEETFDKKKLSPEKQTAFKDDDEVKGDGLIEEGDDEEKELSPRMKYYKKMAFQKKK